MYVYIILGVYIFLCWIFILHGPHGSLCSWERILWYRSSLESENQSCLTLWPLGLYSPWNSPGQNTEVDSLSLLQGIFPNQGSNPGLLHCRWILYQLSQKQCPRILEWVDYPFSSGSAQLRNWTGVSCTTGEFFTNWDIRGLDHHLIESSISLIFKFLVKETYFSLYNWLSVSRSVVPDSLQPSRLQPTRLLCPWDFPGKDTGVGCHFLLQGYNWLHKV